ncbi:MAG: class I poly(R)-hydroxyalkanoic acid synthase, partial [Pseudomonadota bacterium]
MTTSDTTSGAVTGENLDKLNTNLRKVEELTKRLTQVMTHRSTHNAALDGPNQELFGKAATAYWHEAMRDPAKVLEHQLQFWSKSVTHFVEAQQALASGKLKAPDNPGPKDRRFANPLWDTHPYFNFVKQQYLINADAVLQAVDDVTDLDPKEKQRLSYFSQQILDMMSPTNFLA